MGWLPKALPICLKISTLIHLRADRRLDLPVRYIRVLVNNGQCLNSDLNVPEESAKAQNRAWIAYLALVVSRSVIGIADMLGDWSNAENTMSCHAETI